MGQSPCFIGIDVGTGSARAGIFTAKGRCSGRRVSPFGYRSRSPISSLRLSEDYNDAQII